SYMPCFCAGEMAARTAAAAMGVPLYRFSHQAGHIAAALYGAGRIDLVNRSFVAFHLSGGTTESVWVRSLLSADMPLLSGSSDLNAGQVIDRVGHLLGLPFPAGPSLDALAQNSQQRYRVRIKFHEGGPCLSGVENQCAAMLQKGAPHADIARYALDAILSALIGMIDRAREATHCDTMLFAGGVMSNSIIRPEIERYCGGIFAPRDYSCDNAAGIAVLTALQREEPFG
ncbi:MAG: peptidase M22, partial [Oscillospiraceae bacterium]